MVRESTGWWAKFILLLVWHITLCCSEQRMLYLNADTSLGSTVSSIVVDTDERLVVVDLKRRRRCDNPTFMVRLSGTALYLLNLTRQEYEPVLADPEHIVRARQNTYYYSYPPIQDSGLYFLEVLALMCEAFRPSSLVGHCVEDHWRGRNVVTAANSHYFSPCIKAYSKMGIDG
jgi:hypothetical protein